MIKEKFFNNKLVYNFQQHNYTLFVAKKAKRKLVCYFPIHNQKNINKTIKNNNTIKLSTYFNIYISF